MFPYVVLSFVLIHYSNADCLSRGIPEIYFKNDSSMKSYIVENNKPLNIIFENFNATQVRCGDNYMSPIQQFTNNVCTIYGTTVSVIKVSKVTSDMSTRWKCKMSLNNDLREVDVVFTLHVKGAKTVNLYVNGISLKPLLTSPSITEYDGGGQHSFTDGDNIALSCYNPYNEGFVALKYYNAHGALLHENDSIDKRRRADYFYYVLSSDKHNSYIDCIYTSVDPYIQYIYRTFFILKNEEKPILVAINGTMLVPVVSNTNVIQYQYNYTEKYVINMTCEKRENKRGKLRLYKPRNLNVIENEESPSKINILLSTTRLNNNTVRCGIDNTDLDINLAEIQFLASNENMKSPQSKIYEVASRYALATSNINSTVGRSGSQKKREDQWQIIIISSLIILTLIITAVCLVYWYRRIKAAALNKSAYDNISNVTSSTTPVCPSQIEYNDDGNQNAHILDGDLYNNLEENYMASEHIYTEIDEYFIKPNTTHAMVCKTIKPPFNNIGDITLSNQTKSLNCHVKQAVNGVANSRKTERFVCGNDIPVCSNIIDPQNPGKRYNGSVGQNKLNKPIHSNYHINKMWQDDINNGHYNLKQNRGIKSSINGDNKDANNDNKEEIYTYMIRNYEYIGSNDYAAPYDVCFHDVKHYHL